MNFPGLTRTSCCKDCTVEKCVLSEQPYCANPAMGGLQIGQLNDKAAIARVRVARIQLGLPVLKEPA